MDCLFIALLFQDVKVVHDTLDKGLLEIGMDNTCRRGSLCVFPYRPLSHFVRSSGEEAGEVEGRPHGGDTLGQRRFCVEGLALFESSGIIHGGEAFFEADRDRQDGFIGAVGLDPFHDLGQILVLLPEIVLLGQVDEIDNGLGGEEEQGIDDFDLGAILMLASSGHV